MITTRHEHCNVADRGTTHLEDRMAPDIEEVNQLLEAWMVERGRSIECLLLLDRVRRLLRRLTADGSLTDDNWLKARNLLRAIDVVRKEQDAPGV